MGLYGFAWYCAVWVFVYFSLEGIGSGIAGYRFAYLNDRADFKSSAGGVVLRGNDWKHGGDWSGAGSRRFHRI